MRDPSDDHVSASPPPYQETASSRTAESHPAEPSDPLPRVFGRYELRTLLGRGGMGAVYLAHDAQLDRLVALKIPALTGIDRDSLRKRFLREARVAAELSHPNVCPVYEVGEVDGILYLTMAFVDGVTLSKVIHRDGPLPVSEAVRIARIVALAVHEAHRHKVIHRDIKPSNIMLNTRCEPIIMDFGLARRSGSTDADHLTRSGAVLGTPAYMAPEQAGGDADSVGLACDIYSLGVVLYEMLTGRVPFQGAAVGKLLAQIERDPPPPPWRFRAGLDPALERACLKALAKLPEQRFASMEDFAAALAPFVMSGTDRAFGLALRTTILFAPQRRHRPAFMGIAMAAFAILATTVGFFVSGFPEPERRTWRAEIRPSSQSPPGTSESTNDGGWVPLFSGPEQPTWTGFEHFWTIEDGVLTGSSHGTDLNTFIVTQERFRNFEIKFQIRLIGERGNSGLQVRSRLVDPNKFVVYGPQVDAGPGMWASLYQAGPGGYILSKADTKAAPMIKVFDFNDFHVKCVGKRVTITFNGVIVNDVELPNMPDEGVLAWQIHRVHRDHEMSVIVKNAFIRELPDDSSPNATTE